MKDSRVQIVAALLAFLLPLATPPVSASAVVSGTTLSGAGGADASMAWIGVIPQTGMYLIAVDSKGGPASYTLTVQFQ